MVSEISQGIGKSYSEYPYQQVTDKEINKLHFKWFMRNGLPQTLNDGVYLYNTDSKGNGGKHWQCFCLKYPNIYFVDPFGSELNGLPSEELREFGKRNGYKMIYANEYDIQALLSWLCGYYSLYFATKMRKYFNQLNPKTFDTIIHKGYTRYPSDTNVKIITEWSKKVGIL